MQNIGERLEEARKRKGISIREAAEATKVRGDYLHKFESNQFDINLPDIYVRGFLRNYARYLNLPAEKIINDYNALGHNAATKPKSLNREIYGRMDLTVASSKDTGREDDDIESSDEADPENPATFKPKPGALPYVDKALILKGSALVAAVAILVVLVVVSIRMFSGDSTDDTPLPTTDSAAVAAEPTIIIHALDSARIKLVEEATGIVIFQGAITRGENRTFPKNGKLYLTADPMENIEVEIDGDRVNIATSNNLYGRQRVLVN